MDFSDWFTNQIIKGKKKSKKKICVQLNFFFLFAVFLQVKKLFENYLGLEREQEHAILISSINTFFLSKSKHFQLILKNTLELQTSHYNNFKRIIFLF